MRLMLAAADHFDQDFMLSIINETLELMLKCSWPMLMAAIIVGVLVAMFQSVTQVQEQTLSFVPKLEANFLAVSKYGPEICGEVQGFAARILGQIGEMGASNSMFHH